jgi:hypothetical protein
VTNSAEPRAAPIYLALTKKEQGTMQRYRADTSYNQKDGAVIWNTNWMGGPTLAKIENCRLNLSGEPRRTVYITGEPDTFFTIPAATRYLGKYVKGYVTGDDEGNLVFRHVYY